MQFPLPKILFIDYSTINLTPLNMDPYYKNHFLSSNSLLEYNPLNYFIRNFNQIFDPSALETKKYVDTILNYILNYYFCFPTYFNKNIYIVALRQFRTISFDFIISKPNLFHDNDSIEAGSTPRFTDFILVKNFENLPRRLMNSELQTVTHAAKESYYENNCLFIIICNNKSLYIYLWLKDKKEYKQFGVEELVLIVPVIHQSRESITKDYVPLMPVQNITDYGNTIDKHTLRNITYNGLKFETKQDMEKIHLVLSYLSCLRDINKFKTHIGK